MYSDNSALRGNAYSGDYILRRIINNGNGADAFYRLGNYTAIRAGHLRVEIPGNLDCKRPDPVGRSLYEDFSARACISFSQRLQGGNRSYRKRSRNPVGRLVVFFIRAVSFAAT